MEEKKEVPSSEVSLRSVSWHLKCLVEEIKKINELLQSKNVPF